MQALKKGSVSFRCLYSKSVLYMLCRSAYEVAVNTVKLNLHYHSQYCYDGGALHRNTVGSDGYTICKGLDNIFGWGAQA